MDELVGRAKGKISHSWWQTEGKCLCVSVDTDLISSREYVAEDNGTLEICYMLFITSAGRGCHSDLVFVALSSSI